MREVMRHSTIEVRFDSSNFRHIEVDSRDRFSQEEVDSIRNLDGVGSAFSSGAYRIDVWVAHLFDAEEVKAAVIAKLTPKSTNIEE